MSYLNEYIALNKPITQSGNLALTLSGYSHDQMLLLVIDHPLTERSESFDGTSTGDIEVSVANGNLKITKGSFSLEEAKVIDDTLGKVKITYKYNGQLYCKENNSLYLISSNNTSTTTEIKIEIYKPLDVIEWAPDDNKYISNYSLKIIDLIGESGNDKDCDTRRFISL